MGEVEVPADAYYGASTQRAVLNFPISGQAMPRRFIRALGMVKRAAAQTNRELGLLPRRRARAIAAAAQEVIDGKLDDQFPIDVYQTGSGTSTNTNANEVIANRATEILGGERGSKLVHPNDHVNLGQSSNDVIPTAIQLAAALAIQEELVPALERLRRALEAKSDRKSTRLNSSHMSISYAVFCLKKKKKFKSYTQFKKKKTKNNVKI